MHVFFFLNILSNISSHHDITGYHSAIFDINKGEMSCTVTNIAVKIVYMTNF